MSGSEQTRKSAAADRDAHTIYNYHRMGMPLRPASAIFCLCSLDVRVAARAAELFLDGLAPLLIYSGNSGAQTAGLFSKPEAEVFADVARALGVPDDKILVEPRATNTGENVRFTHALLQESGIAVDSFVLVQKPYMERRTYGLDNTTVIFNLHVTDAPGPNPWQVIVILEELQIPYEVESIGFEDTKVVPFTDANPKGRVPGRQRKRFFALLPIEDPNTGLTLWETGAIIQYLIKQYDTSHRLSYDTFKEENICNQWLMFQVRAHGPYFGQCNWFTYLHSEKLPSAVERYAMEIKRVLGALESVLAAKSGDKWLVGDRITFADLAFVPWNDRLDTTLGVPDDKKFDGFPHVKDWHERMTKRPSWVKAMELRARLMDEQGLDWNGMPKGATNCQEHEESGIDTAQLRPQGGWSRWKRWICWIGFAGSARRDI